MTFALTSDAMTASTLLPDPLPATPRQRHAALCLAANSQLTLGIIHELNNLTGGIAVLSEIYLGEDAGDAPANEGLELISKSSLRLQALVKNLKLIHGPLEQEPTYVDLCDCTRSLLDVFLPVLPKNTTIETDCGSELFAARIDEALFRHALLAITLEIRHHLQAHPAAGHGVRVSLRRVGQGLAEITLGPTDAAGVDLRVDPAQSEHPERVEDAAQTMNVLGGALIRGSHGEYILEVPLVD